MKVINTLAGKEGSPFFFGKLFIQGNEIKGFPPSPESFEEIFSRYNLDWNLDLYSFSYQSLEVIAFPDENNWHPVSLYKNLGFKEVKKIGKLSLMERSL